jgi:hypothetical protein
MIDVQIPVGVRRLRIPAETLQFPWDDQCLLILGPAESADGGRRLEHPSA